MYVPSALIAWEDPATGQQEQSPRIALPYLHGRRIGKPGRTSIRGPGSIPFVQRMRQNIGFALGDILGHPRPHILYECAHQNCVLKLLSGASLFSVRTEGLVMLFLHLHNYGIRFIPQILGVLLAVACFVHLIAVCSSFCQRTLTSFPRLRGSALLASCRSCSGLSQKV